MFGDSISTAYVAPRRGAAFLGFALCGASGLSGVAVSGELKLGLRECCNPLMTEVWRWCRLDTRLCRPVSITMDEAGFSLSGMIGRADGPLEDEPVAWDVPCRVLPLVVEGSLD